MKSSTQTYSDQPKNQGFLQIFIVLATVHVRLCTMTSVLHGFQRKSQGFLQIFVVLASLHVWLCAIVSRAAHRKLSVLLTKSCQMKRQTVHFEVAECFHAGGSLSSDGAGTTQAGSIHQRIWICCFAHLLKLTCCKTERRSEERRRKRGEGRKYRSGTISDLWKRLESKNRYAHSL